MDKEKKEKLKLDLEIWVLVSQLFVNLTILSGAIYALITFFKQT